MTSRTCPDCLNPIKVCRDLGGCGRGEKLEAYGVKGMKSQRWTRVFADHYAMNAWAEKNGAEIHGTRKLTGENA
jgi:hypothetical protein